MQAAAKHLTPVTLELGGKSPTIVAADADLEVAARRIMWGKLMNAGQTCIAPDYVLVESSVKDRLVEKMVATIGEFYGADPALTPDLGRIVNERHHDRLTGLVKGAGGQVVTGGTFDRSARYLAPTIIVDPDLDSPIMNEEIFGPVLPVIGVDSIEDAIMFVNDRDKPLALYVFSGSDEIAQRVLSRTSSGGACINHAVVHILPDNMPFEAWVRREWARITARPDSTSSPIIAPWSADRRARTPRCSTRPTAAGRTSSSGSCSSSRRRRPAAGTSGPAPFRR